MNEAGVLGRFIPDFGRIVAMMQFNMYHHYTVDEHLLRADRRPRRHRSGPAGRGASARQRDLAADPATGTALYRRAVPARHRQGPPRGSFDRRRRGRAQALPALRPRRDAETETVAWLVEHHLLMSTRRRAAISRDPQDDRDLRRRGADAGAAEDAAHADRLRHPRRRPGRLERLEGRAPAHALLGDRGRARPAAIRRSIASGRVDDARRTSCAPRCPTGPTPSSTPMRSATIPAYWLKVDLPRSQARAASSACRREAEMRSLATEVATDAFRGVTELTVVAPDHPRLLADHRRRLRGGGRQHRRRADLHHDRRPGARHDLRLARLRRRRDELRRAERVATRSSGRCAARSACADLVAAEAAAHEAASTTLPRRARSRRSTTRCRTATPSSRSRASTGPACSTI